MPRGADEPRLLLRAAHAMRHDAPAVSARGASERGDALALAMRACHRERCRDAPRCCLRRGRKMMRSCDIARTSAAAEVRAARAQKMQRACCRLITRACVAVSIERYAQLCAMRACGSACAAQRRSAKRPRCGAIYMRCAMLHARDAEAAAFLLMMRPSQACQRGCHDLPDFYMI